MSEGYNCFLILWLIYQFSLSLCHLTMYVRVNTVSSLYSERIQLCGSNINPCPAEPRIYPAFANSVDPDQLASEEAN